MQKKNIGNSLLSFNTKHPIFLPQCYFQLLSLYYHQIVLHNGINETLNEIRTKIWVSKTRNFIQQKIRSYSTCKKYDTHSYKYPINQTDLQNLRVSCEPPFTFTLLHLLIMQDLCIYNVYTKEVNHTKFGYSYLHVLRFAESA